MSWILWVGGRALLPQWNDGVCDGKTSQQVQAQELSWGKDTKMCGLSYIKRLHSSSTPRTMVEGGSMYSCVWFHPGGESIKAGEEASSVLTYWF